MTDKLPTVQYTISSDTYMHSEPCIIHAISHSNPQTSVKLTVDGKVEHESDKPTVLSFNVWGTPEEPSLIRGMKVNKFFRVEAEDAHCIVIVEPLPKGDVLYDETVGTRACPICDKIHQLDLDTNYIRCSCGTMFNGELK